MWTRVAPLEPRAVHRNAARTHKARMADSDDAPAQPTLELEEDAAIAVPAEANGHVEPPSPEEVRAKIDAWLSTIEIGGAEERGYDSADLAQEQHETTS